MAIRQINKLSYCLASCWSARSTCRPFQAHFARRSTGSNFAHAFHVRSLRHVRVGPAISAEITFRIITLSILMTFDISFLMHRLSAISPPYWPSPVPGSLVQVQPQWQSRSSQPQRLSEPRTMTLVRDIASVIAWRMVSLVCPNNFVTEHLIVMQSENA